MPQEPSLSNPTLNEARIAAAIELLTQLSTLIDAGQATPAKIIALVVREALVILRTYNRHAQTTKAPS